MLDTDTFPARLLIKRSVLRQLSVNGRQRLATLYSELIADQCERIEADADVSRVPLIWRALAESVGLTVDNDGRIIDGPRAEVQGLVEPAYAHLQHQ